MPMKRTLLIVCVAGVLARVSVECDPPSARARARGAFDVLITNGRVVDGTGAPWYRADVGIAGDRIAAIGQLAGGDAKTRIDASNLVVAPGFIDMLGQSEFNVLVDPRAASKITQGITTEITGEGSSIAPLNDALAKPEQPPYDRFKIVARLPHARRVLRAAREEPPRDQRRHVRRRRRPARLRGRQREKAATAAELGEMKKLVDAGDGAGRARRQHVAAIRAGPLRLDRRDRRAGEGGAQYGGIYISHQRSESARSSRRSTRRSPWPSARTSRPRCGT